MLGVRPLKPAFLQQDREAVRMGSREPTCLNEVSGVEAAETVLRWTEALLLFGVASPSDGCSVCCLVQGLSTALAVLLVSLYTARHFPFCVSLKWREK